MNSNQNLPVDEVLPSLVQSLREREVCLLRAPTGAGKTTRVPQALLDAGLAGEGLVILLEPRRVAARAAARRIAQERGSELGGEVGYQVRFDRKASARTRILAVTEGVLVRMLQDDPFLEGVGAVILDEFHERHLDGDLALALLRRVQADAREDLKLVVMSATLATDDLSRWLGDAPVIESLGRSFDVDIRYKAGRREERLEDRVQAAVLELLDQAQGDVLVFFPGVGEIKRAQRLLAPMAKKRDIALVELYGDLPPEAQDRVLRPSARRRIVLSTNVAESSVTLEGVRAVIDTGLVRRMRLDPAVGLDKLELGQVSRSSADQRSGRAGREAPGLCLRLWSEMDQRALPPEELPEIRRVDLCGALLQLYAFGEREPARFPWFEAPAPAALDAAEELLRRLGAVDANGLTKEGRAMSRLPLHPRLARLLLEGKREGVLEPCALAAALLSDRDPFPRQRGVASWVARSDVLERVQALDAFDQLRRVGPLGEPHRAGVQAVLRARDQLLRIASKGKSKTTKRAYFGAEAEEPFLRALFAAFPDRLARRRQAQDQRAVMVGGKGVRLEESSGVSDSEFFLCIDLDGVGVEARVRQASAIEREWIDAVDTQLRTSLRFDTERERVLAQRETLFADLVLEQVEVPGDPEAVSQLLAETAAADPARALNLSDPDVQQFFARIAFLRTALPELDLPDWGMDGGSTLKAVLPGLCQGLRSFAELRKAPLLDHLRGSLSQEQLQGLKREAPTSLKVPSGNNIRLLYEAGRPPVLAARIQELFGWTATPRVARGRVAVLLHLLAPNMRPQQVTEDLESFWSNTYQVVRKELRRRYPKHDWPEDPTTAVARKRGGPRRR